MNCVVCTWLLGAISDDLADIVSQRGAFARTIWLAIDSQFLGNRVTRALYADQEFRAFTQGDLSVVKYSGTSANLSPRRRSSSTSSMG